MSHRFFIATAMAVLLAGAALANGSDMHFRMDNLPTADELLAQQQYQYFSYGYPMVTPEGFIVAPGNWWLGDQPYLPYAGYGQPIPSPLLVSPSVVVPPLFASPVMPAPTEITPLPNGGYSIARAPNFQLYSVPQYPNFLTTGSAMYPTPQFYYPPYPYLVPPFPWRDGHEERDHR